MDSGKKKGSYSGSRIVVFFASTNGRKKYKIGNEWISYCYITFLNVGMYHAYYLIKGESFMGLMVIFGLVALLAAYGGYRALKNKNLLGVFWGVASFFVFGWFTVMTIINNGIPTGTH